MIRKAFQASPRFAKNAPKSRFTLRGPPIPGLGNPEEDGCSIPIVCNLEAPLGRPSEVRGSVVVGLLEVVVIVGGGAAGITGDTRGGDRGAESERDRLVEDAEDDEDLDADERDDLFLLRNTGRRGGAAAVVAEGWAAGCCEM